MTIAELMRKMRELGAPPEAIELAVAAVEAASSGERTKRQERNRRYYESHQEELQERARERKARLKPSETTETAETRLKPSETAKGETPSPSPQEINSTPLTPTPSPSAIASGEPAPAGADPIPPKTKSSDWPADAFEQFWSIYPNRTNRKKAAETLRRVQFAGKTPWAAIIAGVENLIRHTDPRFIPHATTWLNGERWNDEYATPAGAPHAQQSTRQNRTHSPARSEGTAARVAAIMGYGPQSSLHGSEEERRLQDRPAWPEGRDAPGIIDAHPGPTGVYRA